MTPTKHLGIGMTSRRTRERLIERLQAEGVSNLKVLDAMRNTPRHIFVEEALASRAYEDTALPIGLGQTISQPYIVARMTEVLLAAGPLDTVLEVGTGSGYQTAVLSPLVNRVYSVERIEAFIKQARSRFQELRLRNIRLRHCDGGMGLPQYAPFDGILVTAAPEGIPLALVEQLAVGGRMVIPVGSREGQALVLVVRTEDGYDKEMIERVVFVPLLGGTQ
ncbi:Protein-L-isoaspartate O-methyltransferase [hydrothermal vent metagenome]|uniref:protein-L-isoaspartate(D-aspartate) O-methyltransferase n=1 Tax=hydrothermal vent metagenome TaxID=652676 RepID=A0A3B1AP71_9ZZZZ